MRFRFRRPTSAACDLEELPLSQLVAEVERRGLQVTAPRSQELVGASDVLGVMRQLGKIAGEDFPTAVEIVRELRIANADLVARSELAEAQVALLAADVMAVELERLQANQEARWQTSSST